MRQILDAFFGAIGDVDIYAGVGVGNGGGAGGGIFSHGLIAYRLLNASVVGKRQARCAAS
jgi:hypothetical protein